MDITGKRNKKNGGIRIDNKGSLQLIYNQ